ncbi:Isochorismatase family protein [Paenibacillus sp. NFR01]|nr:Isochorismatase family protein [Paenibacillus sp. NFR01]
MASVLRTHDQVVVHVSDIEGMDESNQKDYVTIPEIEVLPRDKQLSKEHSNAFWNTELEQLLREQGVELVILSGFAVEHCVTFTYNGASERGFKPVLLQNGIMSRHSDAVAAAYRDRNVISYPVVGYLVNKELNRGE